MNVEIIARTYENGKNDEDLEQSFAEFSYILGGRTGGTCYAKDGYFDKGIHDTDRALRIAKRTSESGHHSVFEHSHVTLTITGIPKMLAMLLNSTNCYVTSEKSARYTSMNPRTELERYKYDSWFKIIRNLIVLKYLDKDIPIDKLAMENARYMLDVFTPTSMCYTVSYRQLCYMTEWLDNLTSKCMRNNIYFYRELSIYARELSRLLKCKILDSDYSISSNKRDNFKFIGTINQKDISDVREYIGDIYGVKYKASLACLAQLQRHRSLNYEMFLNNEDNNAWYVPKIIAGTIYEPEWINDLNTLKQRGVYPQALMVDVYEHGSVDDYMMKAQERLCARAQLEIMDNTIETMNKFKKAADAGNMGKYSQDLVNQWFTSRDDAKIKLKCQVLKCLEPCIWGGVDGKNRLI